MSCQKPIIISQRLGIIAEMVPAGASVADVGTDHGYIPIWLVQNGRIKSVIASDIGKLPLEHSKASAREYEVYEKLDFRLCAGLDGIGADEVDTIIIAGMGGETIVAILENAPWTKDGKHLLLLQPMTKAEYLRAWLSENSYHFENERLVFENNDHFPIMAVRGGAIAPLSFEQINLGVALDGDELYCDALMRMLGKLEKVKAALTRSESENSVKKRDEVDKLIDAVKRRKGEIDNADS